MQFGLFNLMTMPEEGLTIEDLLANSMALVKLADEVGFDVAWFAEHHFSNYSISPSPMMMAAHAAGITKRIQLGAAVLVLPLYHPMRVIQEVGLLDLLSEGRSLVGLGSGYQGYEFDRFGQSLDDRTEVTLEIWDMLDQALESGEIEYQGKHYSCPHTPILVRTQAARKPDIYVTGSHPEILRRCALGGHTPFVTGGFKGFTLAKQLLSNIGKVYEEAGCDFSQSPIAVQQYVHVTDSKTEAEDFARRARYVGRIVAQMRAGNPVMEGPFIKAPPAADEPSLEEIIDSLIIGDPERCAEKTIRIIRDLGASHLSCFMAPAGLPRDRALRSLERFAGEVLPLVEKELGPLVNWGRGQRGEAAA